MTQLLQTRSHLTLPRTVAPAGTQAFKYMSLLGGLQQLSLLVSLINNDILFVFLGLLGVE